jgi:hypothetical protein
MPEQEHCPKAVSVTTAGQSSGNIIAISFELPDPSNIVVFMLGLAMQVVFHA